MQGAGRAVVTGPVFDELPVGWRSLSLPLMPVPAPTQPGRDPEEAPVASYPLVNRMDVHNFGRWVTAMNARAKDHGPSVVVRSGSVL